jgi:hypothetical protein
MKQRTIDLPVVIRIAQLTLLLLAGFALAACGTPREEARAVEISPPTVTFEYDDEQGLVDAALRAEEYCRQYDAWPTTTDTDTARDGGGSVTFVCDRDRRGTYTGAAGAAMPANPTVDFTYRDEQSLIEATTQAQHYCARFGAQARSSVVTTAADGTRRVTFECVPGR